MSDTQLTEFHNTYLTVCKLFLELQHSQGNAASSSSDNVTSASAAAISSPDRTMVCKVIRDLYNHLKFEVPKQSSSAKPKECQICFEPFGGKLQPVLLTNCGRKFVIADHAFNVLAVEFIA